MYDYVFAKKCSVLFQLLPFLKDSYCSHAVVFPEYYNFSVSNMCGVQSNNYFITQSGP